MSLDLWEKVERFAKSAAKRTTTLGRFLDILKPKLSCGTIHPRWMAVDHNDAAPIAIPGSDGEIATFGEHREFLTRVLGDIDHRRVLDLLYRETCLIVLLVRDRLEREKPLEATFDVNENNPSREITV